MKLRRWVIGALALALALASPGAEATNAPAPLLSRQSFTTGLGGWAPGGDSQLATAADPVDPALSIFGEARSPVLPGGTVRVQYHFRHLDYLCCYYSRLIRILNENDEPLVTVDNYGSTLVIQGATAVYESRTTDNIWHRLDAVIGTGSIDVLYDGLSLATVAPASMGAPARIVVGSPKGQTIRIDEVRTFGAGSMRQESFYFHSPATFEVVDQGSGRPQEVNGGSVAARDPGYLRTFGDSRAGERHYVRWPVGDLGSRFEAGAEFRIANTLQLPDHMAVIAGLSPSHEPLWAVTLSRLFDPNSRGISQSAGLFFVAGSRVERLPYSFVGSAWRSMRATIDLSYGTISLELESGTIAAVGGLPAGTAYLAAGDVFANPGSPITIDGVSILGPSGFGVLDFDGLYSATL